MDILYPIFSWGVLIIPLVLLVYGVIRVNRVLEARDRAAEVKSALEDRHRRHFWYPNETERYIPLHHCDVRGNLVTDCIICKAWSMVSSDKHVDEYNSFWQCPTCGKFFWRRFDIDTNVPSLQAIAGTFVVTDEIPEPAIEAIKWDIQRCPTPKQAHGCDCFVHLAAREGGYYSWMSGIVSAEEFLRVEWETRRLNDPSDQTPRPGARIWWRECIGTNNECDALSTDDVGQVKSALRAYFH